MSLRFPGDDLLVDVVLATEVASPGATETSGHPAEPALWRVHKTHRTRGSLGVVGLPCRAGNRHCERFGFRNLGSHHGPMHQRAPMFPVARPGRAVLLVSSWGGAIAPDQLVGVGVGAGSRRQLAAPNPAVARKTNTGMAATWDQWPRPTCSCSDRAPCPISRVSRDDRGPDPDRCWRRRFRPCCFPDPGDPRPCLSSRDRSRPVPS